MAVTSNKRTKKFSHAAINQRVQRMTLERAKLLLDVGKLHVQVMPGNSKTGNACWTVSLIPMCDCCAACTEPTDKEFEIEGCEHNGGCGYTGCYDIQNDCHNTGVVHTRAINSAIHKADPARYWREIGLSIELNGIERLRINVGGDLTDDDFWYVAALGREHPQCNIMFFTKNYYGINRFLENDLFPNNVKAIISIWPGVRYENPHHLPESHIVWDNGTTTLKDGREAIYCGGNCSVCHTKGTGCWSLKAGEAVLLFGH